MSLVSRYRLSRDRTVTVANLVDELLRRRGDCDVSVGEDGPFRLSELHSEVCAMDAFLRRTVELRPGEPVAVYRTNHRSCFHWFLAIIRAGGIAVPLNPHALAATKCGGFSPRAVPEFSSPTKPSSSAASSAAAHSMCAPGFRTMAKPKTLPGFLRVGEEDAPLPPSAIDPAATIAVFHTSGTSGFPKGAALSSRALLGARSSTVITGLFLGPRTSR